MMKFRNQLFVCIVFAILLFLPLLTAAKDNYPAQTTIQKWVRMFQPSSLTPEERVAELRWFQRVSKPLRTVKIKSVAEGLETHVWERDLLAKAFEAITGIRVEHAMILYWFRYDWFTDPVTMAAFKKRYGYDLGVPINWAAYGDIAQIIFQYIAFLNKFTAPGSPVVGCDGRPVWRVALTPRGRYWDDGMKVGYQDAGSWTIPWNGRGKYRAAAWLWAHFCLSKTVSVKKFLAGGTVVCKSTVSHPHVLKNAYRWGGLVAFYNSSERKKWTDTGTNVPHYPALSGLWWSYIARAVKGELTPQETMTGLAMAQDEAMAKLKLEQYPPKLNPLKSRSYWLNQPGAPKPPRRPERPRTISYDKLINKWKKK